MPSVFLSYSRADVHTIERLGQSLSASGVFVWRDQEKLYGGQNWPKVLGEAIADRECFLLAWSKQSATSHFVEFEWTTALALKKTIVPCLLDTTPLPPSLAATHALPVDDLPSIVAVLTGAVPSEDLDRRTEVVGKLEAVTATKPEEVVTSVRTMFEQRHWVVQGHVIQGENVTVTIGPRTNESSSKTLSEKWQVWVVVVGGLLAAVLTAFQIKEKVWPPPSPSTVSSARREGEPAPLTDQRLAGTIYGERNKRLSGVQVKLPEFHQVAVTDENGRFEFTVRASQGQQVELVAQKDAYDPMERLASVGNDHYDFTMERTRR
jgi:hypothetical protein